MYEIKPGLLVFLGAALGTLSRSLIDSLIASTFVGINVSTVFVNVLGAFLMGGLITTWGIRRGMHPLWDRIKIFAGTGFLGAFTTYSALALAIARGTNLVLALGAGALTILAGVAGAWFGTRLAKHLAAKGVQA
ncbi:fluoride efflux transporter FluC [Actinomyces urinae]|uniref:fluoride efflux transporter FluC n=1 Tax=Actinomyces urinae TaxID=1689268 RepID=UPI000930C0CB|nr:CrcB family protein [Actinomyces urinae]